jgi:hypothetical protein
MLDTYENIIIGNFLFGFGVEMGLSADSHILPTCCNLLQQGPYDNPLSDLLVFNSNFFRIVEFKRAANDSEKEESKLVQLQRALTPNSSKQLEQVSRKIHWYVKSDTRKKLETWVVPYLDFQKLETPGLIGPTDLSTFAKETAHEAHRSSRRLDDAEVEDCRRYLNLLAHRQKTSTAASGALFLQAVGGRIEYVALPNLSDVFLSPKAIIRDAEMYQERVIRQYELEHQQRMRRQIEREGPGYGRGFGR